MFLLIISILLLIITSIYFIISQRFKYFSKLGIPHQRVKFPFGNTKDSVLGKRNLIYEIDEVYKHFKGKATFVGFFKKFSPYFLILDREVIKKILIQDFKTFRNNDFSGIANEKRDPTIYFNPFLLKDDLWKVKRAEISTAMTLSKLKSMYPLVIDVARNLVEYIEYSVSPLDARDISSRYTCDATSSCLLGVEAHAILLENSEIHEHIKRILSGIMKSVLSFVPKKMFPPDSEKFFSNLVKDAIKNRMENSIQRDDFLAHLISMQQKKDLSEIETIAQAWTIFMDSFETSSIGLHYIFYELAKNHRVQDKLRADILANLDENNQMDFDKLLALEYLDQVFYEALRLHPPLMYTTRVCSENYELDAAKGHKFLMHKGSIALISIYSINRDPEYYSSPDSFHPERFDAEHGGVKAFKDQSILLPFGDGPRTCVGVRFANLLLKTATVEVIRNFKISVNDQVLIDPKIDARKFHNVAECKIMLDFERISSEI